MADIKARLSIGQGEQGPRGLQGPQGRPGIQGPVGPQGERGEKGEQGIPGPVGPKGQDGSVAWSDLSEEQKASLRKELKGEKGDIGPAGPQGKQGIQGLVGPKGDTGLTGPQGPEGRPSTVPGPKGEAGPQGPIGKTGATGPQGPKGEQGLVGPAGKTGPQGPAGPIGPQGPAGAKGKDGKTIKFVKVIKPYSYGTYETWLNTNKTINLNGQVASEELADLQVGDVVGVTGNVDRPGETVLLLGTISRVSSPHVFIDLKSLTNYNKATGGGGTVDAYTKAQSDDRYVQILRSTISDANTATTNGIFSVGSNTKNMPYPVAYGVIEVFVRSVGISILQRFQNYSSNEVWIRLFNRDGGPKGWSEWKKIAITDDLQGTKIVKMPTSKNYSAIKSCADSAFDAVGEYSLSDLNSINIGDFVIIKVQAKDMNNATCMIFAKRIPPAYGSNPRFEGLGMSTAVDTYSKTEADNKFLPKSITDKDREKPQKLPDDFNNDPKYRKSLSFEFIDNRSFQGGIDANKYGNYTIMQNIVPWLDKSLQPTQLAWTSGGANRKNGFLVRSGVEQKNEWQPWKEVAFTDDLHGAIVIKAKKELTVSEVKGLSTYENVAVSTTIIDHGILKQDEFGIIIGKIAGTQDTFSIYVKGGQGESRHTFIYGLGYIIGVDAYSRTEADNQFLQPLPKGSTDDANKFIAGGRTRTLSNTANLPSVSNKFGVLENVLENSAGTGYQFYYPNDTNGGVYYRYLGTGKPKTDWKQLATTDMFYDKTQSDKRYAKKDEVAFGLKQTLGVSTNFDTIRTSGIYEVIQGHSEGLHASFPKEAHPYGILEVIATQNSTTQRYTANKGGITQVFVRNVFQKSGWSAWSNTTDITIDYSRKDKADYPSFFYDNYAGRKVVLYKQKYYSGSVNTVIGGSSDTHIYMEVITPKTKQEGRVVQIAYDAISNKMAKRVSHASNNEWLSWQLVSGPANAYSSDKAERLEAQVADLTVKYERLLAKLGLEDEEVDIPTTGGTLEEHEHNTFEDILNQYIPETEEETLKDKFN